MPKAVDILANPGVRAAQKAAEINNSVGIDDIILSGKKLDADISAAIVGGDIELTIEGAPNITLTVHDVQRKLISKGVIASKGDVLPALDMELDGIIYRLAKVAKTGHDFEMTFEDRDVSFLRRHRKARKAARSKVTRAEFIRMLVNEVKASDIKFVCPELHKKQAISKDTQRKTDKEKDDNKESGFSSDAKITVQGEDATKDQLSNLERSLDVGVSMDAPRKVLIAGMMTIIQESAAKQSATNGSHVGLFQQDPRYWPATRKPEPDAHAFFKKAISVYQDQPGLGYGALAEKVQGAGLGPGPYDQWRAEAVEIVSAYQGDGSVLSDSGKKKYEFKRNNGEDSWTCTGRLADEVGWRRFLLAGTFYYISEEDLFKAKPRITVSEDTEGVDWIDYDIDQGKKVHEVTIHGRMERWAAVPGATIQIEDSGPADGRWLVATVRPSLFNNDIEINCRKPVKEKGEPSASEGSGGRNVSASGAVNQAFEKAKEINFKHLPYTWGGGHNSRFAPGPGYDCSGFISAILHDAGLLDAPKTSGEFESWGQAGKGKSLTIYANATHVFAEFEINGKTVHVGTGDWGKGWGGPGINPNLHPHGGFTARHAAGT